VIGRSWVKVTSEQEQEQYVILPSNYSDWINEIIIKSFVSALL